MEKEEQKELITELAQELCVYCEDFEIIDNPDLKLYDESDAEHLRFPYAVRLYLPNSERYTMRNNTYSVILYINETLDGLYYMPEDYEIEVDHPGWLFIGYANELEANILMQADKIKRLEKKLQDLEAQWNTPSFT